MTRNQDLLDDEMGTPPPSTVDIDTLMARQRRRGRYRMVAIPACVAAATATVVLTVVTLAGYPDRATTAVGSSSRPMPATSGPTAPPTLPLTQRQREAVRLSQAVQHLMSTALPGAQFQPMPLSDFVSTHPTEAPVTPTRALEFVDEGDFFLASAEIKDSTGVATITVSVGQEATQFRHDRACPKGPDPRDVRVQCQVVRGADGALVEELGTTSKYTPYKAWLVTVLRSDGNAVIIFVTNETGGGGPDDAFRSGLPLSLSQTRSLAASPDLATTVK
jgi:hypothetical protein